MSTMTSNTAARATDFIGSIGINTHIDFSWTAYSNTQAVENSINYLGIKNIRDSADTTTDLGTNGLWQQVANATGAKFDFFLGEGAPSVMQTELTYIQQLAQQHILASVEGGDEEDDSYAVANGNSLATSAQFQQQLYTLGHGLGLPVINMSFGAGWNTSASGDYAKVGNISAYSDYSNAHTYFGTGNTPSYNIGFVNSLAQISSNHPTITTEMGWYTTGIKSDATSVSETAQAKYMLDGLMDAYKAGDVKTYLYELLDQKTGDGNSEDNFGLFHSDGTPKAAAVALHNMTTLLADTGTSSATFAPGALSYSLSGTQATDNFMLMEKSDGTYWLSIWNEARVSSATSSTDITVPNHTVTLNLGATAGTVTIFDPLTGTSAIQTYSNTQTVQISLPDHPVLVEISGPQAAASGTTGTTTSGSTVAPTTPAVVYNSSDLALTAPASVATNVGDTTHIATSISDTWAEHNGSALSVTLSIGRGTLSMTDSTGHAVDGSGTGLIHLTGTLDQLNADLATLNYQSSTLDGGQTLGMDVWNQAGVEATSVTAIGVANPYSSQDLSVTTPASMSLKAGSAVQTSGLTINDNWAEHHAGLLALNVSDSSGTLSMTDSNGQAITGSGTNAIHLSGTLTQLNADLATLTYQAAGAAGVDDISVNVWNQAGVSSTQTIAVHSLLSTTVRGTAGNDILSGIPGGSLTGGGGADTFYVTPATTGMNGAVTHITDFSQSAGDKIDLHGFGLTSANFNSNGTLTGSKSFTYVNMTDANHTPYTLIEIDTTGHHTPDHEIRIDNAHMSLHGSDFTFA